MRRVAIAQLGSDQIDEWRFAEIVVRLTIQRILPVALRAVARRASDPRKSTLLAAAVRCETDGTGAAASSVICRFLSARAADAISAAVIAVDYATEEKTTAAASAAANAAADAARLAARVRGVNADRVLTMAAEIAVEALQECGSQGCRWLWLCDE
jgi:hypothetical protein